MNLHTILDLTEWGLNDSEFLVKEEGKVDLESVLSPEEEALLEKLIEKGFI